MTTKATENTSKRNYIQYVVYGKKKKLKKTRKKINIMNAKWLKKMQK